MHYNNISLYIKLQEKIKSIDFFLKKVDYNYIKEINVSKAVDEMICQNCGIKNATVHFTNINGEKITEYHLCELCAKEKGITVNMGINDLVSGFFGMKPQGGKQILKCDFCGLTQNEVSKRGKAGCANCYSVFSEILIPIVRKVHGTDIHIGKQANLSGKVTEKTSDEGNIKELKEKKEDNRIEDLEIQMKTAITEENYERAAELRDEIRKLKEEA